MWNSDRPSAIDKPCGSPDLRHRSSIHPSRYAEKPPSHFPRAICRHDRRRPCTTTVAALRLRGIASSASTWSTGVTPTRPVEATSPLVDLIKADLIMTGATERHARRAGTDHGRNVFVPAPESGLPCVPDVPSSPQTCFDDTSMLLIPVKRHGSDARVPSVRRRTLARPMRAAGLFHDTTKRRMS